MHIIVDSSVWIDYFRGGSTGESLDYLIDKNIVAVNDLILAELVPFLKMRNQRKIISLLKDIHRFPINIKWDEIEEYQYRLLKRGLNGIGLPDLIIAQNNIQNEATLFSLDAHFRLMSDVIGLKMLRTE